MSYETDEEKVEVIKKWWKDNGLSVIAGTVLGLGAIYGWRFWTDYRDNVAGQASSAFEQLLSEDPMTQPEAVVKQADALKKEFGSTPYAGLSDLIAAKALYRAGDAAAAMRALRDAIAHAPEPALARIAAFDWPASRSPKASWTTPRQPSPPTMTVPPSRASSPRSAAISPPRAAMSRRLARPTSRPSRKVAACRN